MSSPEMKMLGKLLRAASQETTKPKEKVSKFHESLTPIKGKPYQAILDGKVVELMPEILEAITITLTLNKKLNEAKELNHKSTFYAIKTDYTKQFFDKKLANFIKGFESIDEFEKDPAHYHLQLTEFIGYGSETKYPFERKNSVSYKKLHKMLKTQTEFVLDFIGKPKYYVPVNTQGNDNVC
jgi:hypothetical protein